MQILRKMCWTEVNSTWILCRERWIFKSCSSYNVRTTSSVLSRNIFSRLFFSLPSCENNLFTLATGTSFSFLISPASRTGPYDRPVAMKRNCIFARNTIAIYIRGREASREVVGPPFDKMALLFLLVGISLLISRATLTASPTNGFLTRSI